MTEPVRSTRNPRVAAASRLHRARERRATGLTLAEGPHVVGEALRAGIRVVELFARADDEDGLALAAGVALDPVVVEPHVLERISGTESPRGPVAVIQIPPAGAVERDAVIVEVTDPGNAGTILRTAAAFGFDVVAAEGATDLWSPKVLRAGAGAHFHTAIGSEGPTAAIATVVQDGIAPWELPAVLDRSIRWSILVGSEAHGLDRAQAERAEVRVTIPMPGGTESLNAAMAAGIVMYELSRWRSAAR